MWQQRTSSSNTRSARRAATVSRSPFSLAMNLQTSPWKNGQHQQSGQQQRRRRLSDKGHSKAAKAAQTAPATSPLHRTSPERGCVATMHKPSEGHALDDRLAGHDVPHAIAREDEEGVLFRVQRVRAHLGRGGDVRRRVRLGNVRRVAGGRVELAQFQAQVTDGARGLQPAQRYRPTRAHTRPREHKLNSTHMKHVMGVRARTCPSRSTRWSSCTRRCCARWGALPLVRAFPGQCEHRTLGARNATHTTHSEHGGVPLPASRCGPWTTQWPRPCHCRCGPRQRGSRPLQAAQQHQRFTWYRKNKRGVPACPHHWPQRCGTW